MMVEAGTLTIFEGSVGAATQRKGLVYGFPGFPCSCSGGERTKITGSILAGLSHYFQTRIGRFSPDAKQDILFVIAQDDIVMRTVLLDQAGLKQQGLFFCTGRERFQRGRVPNHGNGLGCQGRGRTKIGKNTPAQIACLPHINDSSLSILIEIDARCGWKC